MPGELGEGPDGSNSLSQLQFPPPKSPAEPAKATWSYVSPQTHCPTHRSIVIPPPGIREDEMSLNFQHTETNGAGGPLACGSPHARGDTLDPTPQGWQGQARASMGTVPSPAVG